MVRDVQTMTHKGRYVATEFTSPDLVKMAAAFGVPGLRAENPGEVTEAMKSALAANRPAIVTVPVDPNEMPSAKARMMAMERSFGLPPMAQRLSLGAPKALWSMIRER